MRKRWSRRFVAMRRAWQRRPRAAELVAVAIDGKTLRGSFDAFEDRKATHMLTALRQSDRIVLAHLMVEDKSNEIPAAPELIEALGLKGVLFTLCKCRFGFPQKRRSKIPQSGGLGDQPAA